MATYDLVLSSPTRVRCSNRQRKARRDCCGAELERTKDILPPKASENSAFRAKDIFLFRPTTAFSRRPKKDHRRYSATLMGCSNFCPPSLFNDADFRPICRSPDLTIDNLFEATRSPKALRSPLILVCQSTSYYGVSTITNSYKNGVYPILLSCNQAEWFCRLSALFMELSS